MSTSFTVISLVIYALICVAQKNEWTRIYFDPMVSQGDWVCHEEDADAACVFGWTASPKTTCVDGVCTRLTGDSWIEMPFPLATRTVTDAPFMIHMIAISGIPNGNVDLHKLSRIEQFVPYRNMLLDQLYKMNTLRTRIDYIFMIDLDVWEIDFHAFLLELQECPHDIMCSNGVESYGRYR
eukprot:778540_1